MRIYLCRDAQRFSNIFSYRRVSERLRNVDAVANRNEPYYKVMYAGVNRIDMVMLEALF